MENAKKKQAREAMETAFLLQLRKKPVGKISVTELCKKAGVNRSTFYAHYLDVYDLMDQVTDAFIRKMFHEVVEEVGAPQIGLVSRNGHPLVVQALRTTMENRDLCRVFLSAKAGISAKLIDEVLSWCLERYERFSNRGNPDYTVAYTMMIGGVVALWYDWIQSDFSTPPEQLAVVITRFIERNIQSIWT